MASRGLPLAAAVLALAAIGFGVGDAAHAGEAKVTSGPAVGARMPIFYLRGVTGMGKGTRLCYI
jgi:hypothetical protein